jgi:hypothetical protein
LKSTEKGQQLDMCVWVSFYIEETIDNIAPSEKKIVETGILVGFVHEKCI